MMSLRRALLILGILLVILALHEAEARGSRSRKSSSTSRSRKTQRRPASSSNSKPKQKTFHSSVTHSRILTKKKLFNTRFIMAAATGVVVYKLLNAPVYSGHYRPYYETSNIVIPKHRALRIEKESYRVEKNDANGSHCLNGSLIDDSRSIVNVTTKVSYKKANHVVAITAPIPSSESTDKKQTNLTVSSNAINNYVATIEIKIAFNQSILALNAASNATTNTTIDLTDCKIMMYEAKAYLVESFAFKNEASFVFFLTAFFISIMIN